MGVGGFQIRWDGVPNFGQDSVYIPANQRVGYNSADLWSGVREVDRLFRGYRNRCPGSHIKMLGHSGGAAVLHMWVAQHKYEPNATAILIADPKRAAGPGGDGIAGNPVAALVGLYGTDSDFGDFPVLTVCNAGDWVCNEDAGLHGYLWTGVHANYDMNPWNYPNWISGQWYRGIY
nr:cutinase family protein [Nocardia abscessus]